MPWRSQHFQQRAVVRQSNGERGCGCFKALHKGRPNKIFHLMQAGTEKCHLPFKLNSVHLQHVQSFWHLVSLLLSNIELLLMCQVL